MNGNTTKSSRRAFFLHGGAVLGTGVAAAVGASAQSPDSSNAQLRKRLALLEDREAIRRLHLALTSLIENQKYESAAQLFDEKASDRQCIRELFANHTAYRQQRDTVTLSEDHLRATATFHVDVEVCTPLEPDCTAAEMARLQGNVADRHWESGRFEASYVKTGGEWKVMSLSYRAS